MNCKFQMHERIYVIHGSDPWTMTCRLLEYLQPFKHLPIHSVIGIKPNLVTATPAGHGATTHPEIVEAVVAFLQAVGFFRIKIIESAWVGESTEKAFEVCGCTALAEKYGITLNHLNKDEKISVPVDRIAMGQGHQGSTGGPDLLGIGDCTAGFVCHLPGCLPSPEEISTFLYSCVFPGPRQHCMPLSAR